MLKTKEEKGITLIALVITIIILLILAGVSIAMLTGNNGILTQAKNAKEATEKAAKKENNDKIESLFYYIVNNQELLAKDRAEILLTGSVKVE